VPLCTLAGVQWCNVYARPGVYMYDICIHEWELDYSGALV
jgi:hypothetical protein